MPRYHLNIADGDGYIPDDEGVERADLDSAITEAAKGLRDIISNEILAGRVNLGYRILITDGGPEPLATVTARDVVQVSE